MKHTILILALFLSAPPLFAGDWPQFRGPTGDGQYVGPPLPTRWGPEENLVWKTKIPGLGWSSPAVGGGRIYLATATEVEDGHSLRGVCIDAQNGKILWDQELFHEAKGALKMHAKNSHASSTPYLAGDRVFFHFSVLGTAAVGIDGNVIWKNKVPKFEPVHGTGPSPVLIDGKVIVICDGEDKQSVLAFDAETGKIAWQTPRNANPKKGFAFATPQIIEVDGKKQLLCPGADMAGGYDPATGQEIWRFTYRGYSLIQRPLFGHGLAFLQTGYDTPIMHAVRPGTGDVTESNLVWTLKKAVPNTPSFLLLGDDLFMISDKGVASLVDARTGKVHYSERIPGGGFSASPITDGKKIYTISEEGLGLVLAVGKEFKILEQNPLKERSLASFAPVDGALYIRTADHLYRFENKK